MAQSRLEKVGTIYTRAAGLIRSGALNWEDRPLWYDIYEAFPPKDEPKFDRPAAKIPLRQIFYAEDKIRAVFQKNNKLGTINMFDRKHKTLTQKFLEHYNKVEREYSDIYNTEEIYQNALNLLRHETMDVQGGIATEFTEADAKTAPRLKVQISDVLKE